MIGGLIPALILPYVPVVNTVLPLYYFPIIWYFPSLVVFGELIQHPQPT